MKISRNWLQTYFNEPIPSGKELEQIFTFHSFEVEGLDEYKDPKGEVTDEVLDVKVLPDRAHYALSHKGVALEVALNSHQGLKANRIPKGPQASIETRPVIQVKDPKFCRRYMGRCVELENGNSSASTCALLMAVGQRSINGVVDATNMVMLDVGQPLHAFDADKVKGAIIVRAAKEGEKITLLDGQECILNASDHVIADEEGPLAIAGVKGGKRAEVTMETKRLIIESANFEPTAVRKTSTRLNLRNESSKRYENEITPELTAEAMESVSALLLEMCPKAKFGPVVDEYPGKAEQTKIVFDPSYIGERLGVAVPLDEAKNILIKMGIKVVERERSGSGGNYWELTIPYERLDLTIKEDIVEEVGRIYGYDKIAGVLPPKMSDSVPVLPLYYISEKIKDILVDEGFAEVSLYTLVAKGDIEAAKPLAKDKAFARKNLANGMLDALERNALNADLLGLESVKVFEIGRAFSAKSEETLLCIGATQVKKTKGVNGESIAKQAMKKLEESLGVNLSALKPIVKGGHCVIEINVDSLAKDFKAHSASYKDIKLTRFSEAKFKRFSSYPFIVRDIAVFVPESVTAEDVWQTIEKGIQESQAVNLLARHALFDVFKKEGKISYAFRLVFQANDRTLTDEEANSVMQKINSLVAEKGWQVR